MTETDFRPEDLDLAAMRQYAAEAIVATMRHRHTKWGRFGVRGERCACCGQEWPCDVQVLLQLLDGEEVKR